MIFTINRMKYALSASVLLTPGSKNRVVSQILSCIAAEVNSTHLDTIDSRHLFIVGGCS